MSAPAILTSALTGPIATKDDNPYLSTTPEEIARRTVAPAMGGNVRTPTEGTSLRSRMPARSNAELVQRLVNVNVGLAREPATVADVATRLGLTSSTAVVS